MGLFSRRNKDEASQRNQASLSPVPLLAGDAWLDGTRATLAQIPDFPPGEAPYVRPIIAGLYVVYASDDDGPSWTNLAQNTVGSEEQADALHERALLNLRQRGNIDVAGNGGRFRLTVPAERDLSASLILDSGRWAPTLPITGDLIIAVPTRIELLVCSAENTGDIDSLREAATMLFAAGEGKPVSPGIFQLSGTTLTAA